MRYCCVCIIISFYSVNFVRFLFCFIVCRVFSTSHIISSKSNKFVSTFAQMYDTNLLLKYHQTIFKYLHTATLFCGAFISAGCFVSFFFFFRDSLILVPFMRNAYFRRFHPFFQFAYGLLLWRVFHLDAVRMCVIGVSMSFNRYQIFTKTCKNTHTMPIPHIKYNV